MQHALNIFSFTRWRHATIKRLHFLLWSVPNGYKGHGRSYESVLPCGGGVEYFHRDPASRRRRRKGKSRVWDSKIWFESQGTPTEKECAGKGQQHIQKTDPPARQRGRPIKKQDRNRPNSTKNLVMSPRWGSTPRLTDWLTVSRNVTLTLTCMSQSSSRRQLAMIMRLAAKESNWGTEASGMLSAGQFRLESQPVKGRLYVCCSTVISGAWLL
jgi:hypothetical protein